MRGPCRHLTMQQGDDFGVADGWWGTDGGWHAADDGVRVALRSALGADEHPDGPPDGPAVWFLRPGDDRSVWSPGLLTLADGTVVQVRDRVPDDLPLGAHSLVSDGGHVTRLFSVPGRCRRMERGWGWSVQLPGARSRSSWGHGDLTDLADLARRAQADGAAVLAHNPFGATIPVLPQQPSPYYASSRRFWSPLYLRVEALPGAELAADQVGRAAQAGHDLDASRTVDRDRVWELKAGAIDAIWAQVRTTAAVRGALDAAGADAPLDDHALFCALAEVHGGGRSTFPAEVAHPGLNGARAAAARWSDRVDRWRWVQLQLDQQLGAAASAGAALMADLPVGFDPDGSDAWADQDLLATGCRVGAPPDEFSPTGQDWGLPPYVPWRLRAVGYRPWLDTLRRILRHAGLLRIDHVMGLFRLYCIPPGAEAHHGAYVYQFGHELLDLACMEAVLAGAVLVGEDLGTVEPDVREAMARRDVYGYRVGWFEDDPPSSWPDTSVGMLTTHDLPTVAGLWTGDDARNREVAGLAPDPHGDTLLHDRLARLAGDVADGTDAHAVSVAAHRALADAGSDLVVATLEDAVGETRRPNLPGTVDEHPNWRSVLPVTIEDLDDAGTAELAQVMQVRATGG